MSIETTVRATFASCNVNQPSPEQRSTTSIPGFTPTFASIAPGSLKSASHQPGSGIPVP